jgi:hypothetical protein
MDHPTCALSRSPLRGEPACLACSVREAASQLAAAEATLGAVSRDVDARSALVSEIEALDGEIRNMRRACRDTTGEEACRAASAEKLGALRSIETDARLEEREALALSARELLRARMKRAVADLDAAMTQPRVKEEVELAGAA